MALCVSPPPRSPQLWLEPFEPSPRRGDDCNLCKGGLFNHTFQLFLFCEICSAINTNASHNKEQIVREVRCVAFVSVRNIRQSIFALGTVTLVCSLFLVSFQGLRVLPRLCRLPGHHFRAVSRHLCCLFPYPACLFRVSHDIFHNFFTRRVVLHHHRTMCRVPFPHLVVLFVMTLLYSV